MGYVATAAIFFVTIVSLSSVLLFASEDKKNKFINYVNKF